MTDSPPTEPRARSKSPAPHDRDDRKDRNDSFRDNSDRRDQRQRRDRSRSRDRRDSPPRRPRDRSRSPPRRPRGSGGFKWKGERRDNDRNRDFRRRSPQRHRDRDYGRDRYRRDDRGGDRGGRGGDRDQRRERNEKEKEKPKAPVQQAGEEMIIVNVNDRLGTKAAVPCLESDTVGQLKMMVAARIGRDPGQIILKRQSERPFKDHITLGDYGISNGVQLDLEIDTRD
ncbi:ubiquitin-like modifier hub1 [Fusarium torreyae]|uniref:Ubiquitin-like modifier HUB1 n=1 Tax=Fusarium torreyae TaxID=1237075 RepID=A0A9W8VI72_9HYPO|nr:ubiquitin-like modifier hub1 [Fusarium torreyae]